MPRSNAGPRGVNYRAPEWWRIPEWWEGGTVDLLSARINLTESGMFEEVGTWIEIYDTDLVEVSESEDD